MIVIVSGLPGSGKSTLVERIGQEFELKTVFASGILKQLREEKKIKPEKTKKSTGFWESKEGREFTERRERELFFDKQLDRELLKIAEEEDRVVFDSRTMPWLYKNGFKIWLKASEQVRAKRIAERDKIPKKRALKRIRERFKADKKIYKKLYGFNLGEDFSPFDLVIDSDELSVQEVFETAKKGIEKHFETQKM